MRTSINHFFIHFKTYGRDHEPLYVVSIMLFFWAIFSGIVAYITPILITSHGYSNAQMGLIYSTSSIAGAIFDFIISRVFVKAHFRVMYFVMFALSFFYIFSLYNANTIWLFLFNMAVWGIFYDFMCIGSFDFVGRYTSEDEHASSFGVIDVFRNLGCLLAPIMTGFLLGREMGSQKNPFYAAFLFVLVAFIFYIVLVINYRYKWKVSSGIKLAKKKSLITELVIWEKVGRKILPVLVLTGFLNVLDAFFWTIGPLYSLEFVSNKDIGGLFLTSYMLPLLITGWFVGKITKRFGKKRTAFVTLLVSCVTLLPLFLIESPILIIFIAFIFSIFNTIAWPSMRGTYADYIAETETLDKEIEGLGDLFGNIGYVIGPALAGIMASLFGISGAFSIIGFIGIFISLLLLRFTPREIKVEIR